MHEHQTWHFRGTSICYTDCSDTHAIATCDIYLEKHRATPDRVPPKHNASGADAAEPSLEIVARGGDATGTSAPSNMSDVEDETATSDVALSAELRRRSGEAPAWGGSQSSGKFAQNS